MEETASFLFSPLILEFEDTDAAVHFFEKASCFKSAGLTSHTTSASSGSTMPMQWPRKPLITSALVDITVLINAFQTWRSELLAYARATAQVSRTLHRLPCPH